MPKSFLIIISIVIPLFLFGQSIESSSDHIGSADGLSSQLCKILLEDDFGNMWIGHEKTFDKYDGYNVKEYNALNSFGDEKFVDNLALDQKGRVWMIRRQHGEDHFRSNTYVQVDSDYSVHLVNPLTNDLLSYEEVFPNSPFKLSTVVQIFVRGRSIYFYTTEQELYKYQDEFELLLEDLDKEKFLGVENDTYYFEMVGKHIIARYSFKGDKREFLETNELTNQPWYYFEQSGGLVISSFEKKVDEIYVWKEGKLHTYAKKLRRLEIQSEHPIVFINLKYDLINNLISNNGFLNLDTWGVNEEETKIVNRRFCNDFIVSKTGLLYVATSLGVYIFNLKSQFFLVSMM